MVVTSTSTEIFKQRFARHRDACALAEQACLSSMEDLCDHAVTALANGNRIFFFGNGGSAADAQHLAAEFSVRFVRNRRALPGIALAADSAVLTACGNDFGFDQVFARQIEALGQSGDLAIGLSTSGNSRNVVLALECALKKGMTAAALTGCTGGQLAYIADPIILVPSDDTATIQEVHILLGHILCAHIDTLLGHLQ
jgi:D-sedoheptulose 7-phosphate isomerase